MSGGFKTVKRTASASFTEKKSEFIGHIRPVSSEKEALDFIADIKATYPDATHNVHAFLLQGSGVARFSDDGEPSGTAGMPVLEVIKREGLEGVVIVVTRYFGGILLGAGGLVRAYARAAKLAIDEAGTTSFLPFTEFVLTLRYPDYERVNKELPAYRVKCDNTSFGENVTMRLAVEKDGYDPFIGFVGELTGGKAQSTVLGERYDFYSDSDNT